jgi:probable F420-dependent oxidoreductase
MKIDAPLMATDLASVAAEAHDAETLGYDGVFTFEGPHDPFFPLVLAAEHSKRLELATAIAIAFPRSPMQLANVGHDLNVFAKGRFILGLGSQIKAHIEKRFSATWSRPAARMRELVLALRAIWRCFNENEKLDFRGEFYRHTLMTPFFNPGPSPYGPPRVFVAGVGRTMTRVAGEVADGLFVHPLNSPEFLRAVTVPASEEGLAIARRQRNHFTISVQALVITGFTREEMEQAEIGTKMQIAFYASTPQYRCVLDVHGWGALQPELNALSKQGRWLEMAGLIDERMLAAFTVRGEPTDIARLLRARYAHDVDRISIICHSQPQRVNPAVWREVIADCQAPLERA